MKRKQVTIKPVSVNEVPKSIRKNAAKRKNKTRNDTFVLDGSDIFKSRNIKEITAISESEVTNEILERSKKISNKVPKSILKGIVKNDATVVNFADIFKSRNIKEITVISENEVPNEILELSKKISNK